MSIAPFEQTPFGAGEFRIARAMRPGSLASLLLGLGLMIGLHLATPTADAQSPTVLRIADSFPGNYFIPEYYLKPWMEEVGRASGGTIRFQYFPSEQLGKAKDMLDLTASGVTDIGGVIAAQASDKMPLAAVVELPGLFSSSCAGAAAYIKLVRGGPLQAEFDREGVIVLFSVVFPPYQIQTGKKKFSNLRDLQGLKLRALGGAQDLEVRKLNAVPVKMAAPDVYESLSRGTLDGLIFPYVSTRAYRLERLVRYSSIGENFGSSVTNYVMRAERWRSLPKAIQDAMLAAGEATMRRACARVDAEGEEFLRSLEQDGVTLVRLSQQDQAQLKAIAQEVRSDWVSELEHRGKPAAGVLSSFEAAIGAAQPGSRAGAPR